MVQEVWRVRRRPALCLVLAKLTGPSVVVLLLGTFCALSTKALADTGSGFRICRSVAVNGRLAQIKESIDFIQNAIRTDSTLYDPKTIDPDNLEWLVSQLRARRESITNLEAERARLLNLPVCRDSGEFITDECMTGEAAAEIERLKKLLATEEARLKDDEYDQKLAVGSQEDAVDKKAWAHRMDVDKADVAYDKFRIKELKRELERLSALPACDVEHLAHPDHNDYGYDQPTDPDAGEGQEDESQPRDEESPPSRRPDDRPEIGLKGCPLGTGALCSMTSHARTPHDKDHNKIISPDDKLNKAIHNRKQIPANNSQGSNKNNPDTKEDATPVPVPPG